MIGRTIGVVLAVGAAIMIVAAVGRLATEENRREVHAGQVEACKSLQYDAYQDVVRLGMHRWEAACSAAVYHDNPAGGLEAARKAEQQCFIHLDDCGK